MNPLTAVRLMLETLGEGQRVQAFGHGYREKAEATRVRTQAERQRMEQDAALFPDEAKAKRLLAAKAEAEQLERIAGSTQRGGNPTEADAANFRAQDALEAQKREAKFEDLRIAGETAKAPGAEIPLAESIARRLRGGKATDVGPVQPITNTELPILQDFANDDAAAQRARETNALYREGFRGGSGGGGMGGIGAAANTPEAVLAVARRAIMSLSKPKQASGWAAVNGAMKTGNLDEVKSIVRQLAVEGEGMDDRRLITGRYRMVRGLIDIKKTFQDMQARGVPMDVLSGTAEDVLRKLGQTGNPEYVRLGARLNDMLITYRRASTGVAFGEKEGKQYEALMPNYYNAYAVNFAQIEGLLQAMGSYDRSFWENKLGNGGAVFAGAVEEGGEDMGGTAAMAASRALAPAPASTSSADPRPEDFEFERRSMADEEAKHPGMKRQVNKITGAVRWVPR